MLFEAPPKVNVPVPALTKATDVALPFWITPEKDVEVSLPPAVNTGVPAAELVIVPAPAIEPTVSELPARSRVPVMVTADAFGITPAAPSCKVPEVIVVVPV